MTHVLPSAAAAGLGSAMRAADCKPVRGSPANCQEVRAVLLKQGKAPRDIDLFLKRFTDPPKERTLAATRSATLSVASAAAKCPERRLPCSPVLTEAARFRRSEGFARDAVAQEGGVGSDATIVDALLKVYFGLTATTPAAEAAKAKVLAQEIVFGARLWHAVADSRSASFDFAQCRAGAWPGSCTLSRWYRVATMAGTYSGRVSTDIAELRDHAEVVAQQVDKVRRHTPDKIRVWLIDGVGRILHHLLDLLITRYAWTDARIDSVLEVTLVDQNKSANDFHEWAIPCAKVLPGDVHAIIAKLPEDEFPHVVDFNYTQRNRHVVYEPGSFPGSRYDADARLRDTAASCNTILNVRRQAGVIMALPSDNGLLQVSTPVGQIFQQHVKRLRTTEYKTGSAVTAMYIVTA